MWMIVALVFAVLGFAMYSSATYKKTGVVRDIDCLSDDELLQEIKRVNEWILVASGNEGAIVDGYHPAAIHEFNKYAMDLASEQMRRLNERYKKDGNQGRFGVNAKDPLFNIPREYFNSGLLISEHEISMGNHPATLTFVLDYANFFSDEDLSDKIRVEIDIPALGHKNTGFISADSPAGAVVLFKNISKSPQDYHVVIEKAFRK